MKSDVVLQKPGNKDKQVPFLPFCIFECFHSFRSESGGYKKVRLSRSESEGDSPVDKS